MTVLKKQAGETNLKYIGRMYKENTLVAVGATVVVVCVVLWGVCKATGKSLKQLFTGKGKR